MWPACHALARARGEADAFPDHCSREGGRGDNLLPEPASILVSTKEAKSQLIGRKLIMGIQRMCKSSAVVRVPGADKKTRPLLKRAICGSIEQIRVLLLDKVLVHRRLLKLSPSPPLPFSHQPHPFPVCVYSLPVPLPYPLTLFRGERNIDNRFYFNQVPLVLSLGMNTKEFKYKWGGEDWDLLDRVLMIPVEVERIKYPGLYHHYHDKQRMWN